MKKLILLLSLLFPILSVGAKTFIIGPIKYWVNDEEAATCWVYDVIDKSISGNFTIPAEVTNEDKTYSVVQINDRAFEKCDLLEQIEFLEGEMNESKMEIGYYSFYKCTKLKSIKFPANLMSIGYGAFSECVSLESVEIPKSVEKIGAAPFAGCVSLKGILVEEGSEYYESADGVLFTKGMDTLVEVPASFTTYSVPQSVTKIYDRAFDKCINLSSVSLPDTLASIEYSAFSNCTALTEITIPEGVTELSTWAFFDCKSLETINLPSSLKVIGHQCFAGCWEVKEITLPESMEAIGLENFYYLNKVTILAPRVVEIYQSHQTQFSLYGDTVYVYPNLVSDYKNSLWSECFKNILPLQETGSGIESVEISMNLPFEIYNLSGALIRSNASKDNLNSLVPGVYILRQGNASKKIRIK